MSRRLTLLLLGLFLVPTATRAQEAVGPTDKYRPVAEALEKAIVRELGEKDVPGLSIVLIDDQDVVWARGFGLADPTTKRPATAETIHRVGSVSKLFTDIAVMQLVERGMVDLDAPVEKYLPDFKPRNPFDKPITLRQLMAHRSGLVREPPVGHYFDPTEPTLAETVRSLNETSLVYPPEARTKYSNAAISAVGYVVEKVKGEPFERAVQGAVLDRLGMKGAGFDLSPERAKRLAKAQMWGYDGRAFEAPTFALGIAPAGNLYASVLDLGRFLSVLFAEGKGPDGPVLKPETLRSMYEPQFHSALSPSPFGLGFHVGRLDGKLRVGHGGAVYGFATDLAALPDEKLGVAVVATKDCANGLSTRLADFALRGMLAARRGEAPPAYPESGPVDPAIGRRSRRLVPGAERSARPALAGGPPLRLPRVGQPNRVPDAGRPARRRRRHRRLRPPSARRPRPHLPRWAVV